MHVESIKEIGTDNNGKSILKLVCIYHNKKHVYNCYETEE